MICSVLSFTLRGAAPVEVLLQCPSDVELGDVVEMLHDSGPRRCACIGIEWMSNPHATVQLVRFMEVQLG